MREKKKNEKKKKLIALLIMAGLAPAIFAWAPSTVYGAAPGSAGIAAASYPSSAAAPALAGLDIADASVAAEEDWEDRLIAHGGGEIRGYATTNSREALAQAAARGFSRVELDFSLTSDGQLALIHEWKNGCAYYLGLWEGKPLSSGEFLRQTICGSFQPIVLKGLLDFLENNPGVKVITDTKEDNLTVLRKLSEGGKGLLDRFIPQAYQFTEVEAIHDMGFSDVIFTLYRQNYVDVERLASLAREGKISAVAMSEELAGRGYAQLLLDQGVPVYVHTVNDFETAAALMEQGVQGVYTDSLVPEEFTESGRRFYLSVPDGAGGYRRLEREQISDDGFALRLQGNPRDRVRYLAEGRLLCEERGNVCARIEAAELGIGVKEITAAVFGDDGEKIHEETCLVYLDGKSGWLVSQKYAGSFEDIAAAKDFREAVSEAKAPVRDVLEKSLIAKAGSSICYWEGRLCQYREARRSVKAVRGQTGSVLLPLADTSRMLTGASVTMDVDRQVTVKGEGFQITGKIGEREVAYQSTERGESSVRGQGEDRFRLDAPLELWENKTMAPLSLFELMTGRICRSHGELALIAPRLSGSSGSYEESEDFDDFLRQIFVEAGNLY